MLDAVKVFAGPAASWLDDRFNYGETRWLTAGLLDGWVVLFAWTQRGAFWSKRLGNGAVTA